MADRMAPGCLLSPSSLAPPSLTLPPPRLLSVSSASVTRPAAASARRAVVIALGAAAAASRQSAPTVTCLFGGDKRDAARKALESALGEKSDAFSKWDEEIKKREASGSGGGGKGRGRGWGGGGGSGGGGDGLSSEGNEGGGRWAEALQVGYAFCGLTFLYLILTQGKNMLAVILNGILYVSRGFKPRPASRYPPAGAAGDSADAESHVRSKWGFDD